MFSFHVGYVEIILDKFDGVKLCEFSSLKMNLVLPTGYTVDLAWVAARVSGNRYMGQSFSSAPSAPIIPTPKPPLVI